MIRMDEQVLLVGAGKMGCAMLVGWLDAGLKPEQILVLEPFPSSQLKVLMQQKNIKIFDSSTKNHDPNIVILAVKPQMMQQVIASIDTVFQPGCLFISIAAGQNIQALESYVGRDRAVVRVMPNTPASIGRGMSVACKNSYVSSEQTAICSVLLAAAGEVAWVEDEAMMDAVTAVSGSGPAYIFLLAEVMAAAGQKVGLPADLARQLANVTVSGSGELLRQSDGAASVLRENVTSPGGTTAAALNVLMDEKDGMGQLMDRAVQAAVKRSKELS